MAINPKLLNPGERVVFSTRTHAKALIAPALVLIVTAAGAGFLSSIPDTNQKFWLTAIWGIALVLIGIYSIWPFLVWLNASYTVTDRRLTTHQGVLSRRGHDIPLTRISDVSYEKSVVDRMLGCGTLVITDASETGRVALPDVPAINVKLRLISELLHSTSEQSGERPGDRPSDGT